LDPVAYNSGVQRVRDWDCTVRTGRQRRPTASGPGSALLAGGQDAFDGEHVGGGPEVGQVPVLEGLGQVVEGVDDDGFQFLVDALLVPVEALAILDPLEVGDGDPAGVGEDVGEDADVAVGQDVVGVRRQRPRR